MGNRVVIIGAGLGGLQCGYILAKNGMQVTVLEHDVRIGGCLQSYKRGDVLFDAGFHYVGGLDEGQSLHGLFKYFNLLDLPWCRMDDNCFDEVVIGDRSFPFAAGHERFRERLTEMFPHEKEGLRRYVAFLNEVGNHLPDSFLPHEASGFYSDSLFARSAYDWLCDIIHDPLLRKVLSGTSLKMELNRETLPLYVFAQINNSFIQSAWRIEGGGQQIAEHLAADIRRMGGEVRTNSTVTSIVEQDGKALGVRVNKQEFIPADWIVSNQHPQMLLRLLADSKNVRKVYKHRITALGNTFGMFTANIHLKPGSMEYVNRNVYVHDENADLWKVDCDKVESVLVSFYKNQSALDLLTPMRWRQVAQWAAEPVGHRGQSYVDFKNRVTEDCLQLVEQRFPDLRGAIDRIYTSTPLTYNHYTLSWHGSAYGIRKDWQSPYTTVLTPKTPVSNVLMTGQNLNLHGVLGVSMTSVFTCAQIVGMETLTEQMEVSHWGKSED